MKCEFDRIELIKLLKAVYTYIPRSDSKELYKCGLGFITYEKELHHANAVRKFNWYDKAIEGLSNDDLYRLLLNILKEEA